MVEAGLDEFLWRRAQGYNSVSAETRAKYYHFSMLDWLRYVWNLPSSGKSPYKMFGGILVPEGLDDNGDVIYRYDATKELGSTDLNLD